MSGSISATTLAAVSLGLTAVGTGVSMYGQVQQGQNAAAQARYQAAVANNNKIIAERNAQAIEKQGQAAEDESRQRTKQLIGAQRAHLGGTGTDVNDGGSNSDLTADTAQLGELDALTIRSNYAREAYNARVGGMNMGAQAQLYDASAKSSLSSSYLSAAGSFLGGASSISSQWAKFKSPGGAFA